MALTRSQLDDLGCSTPNCVHDDHGDLHLYGRCHPRAHVDAIYDRRTGILAIICGTCQKPVVFIEVKP